MDIRNAAIYCRGDDTEYQAGLGMSFIIDKGLSYCGLFTDEPEDENPVESLRKLLYHCRYGSIDVIIIKNYDIIEEGSVKRQFSQANLIQPIIGAEDLYCSDEDLDLETLKYEKKRSAGSIHIPSAKDLDNAEISEALRRVYESKRWSGYIAGVVPYGFNRVDGQLIVDPVTAPVVRTIFNKVLEGERITAIARWLSQQGIASPSAERSREEGKPEVTSAD